MSDSTISFFRADAVSRLAAAMTNTESESDALAIIDDFASDHSNLLSAEWSFNGAQPDLLAMHLGGASTDALARAVYSWMGPMTAVEASDHRVWTYLACVTFQSFTANRWALNARNLHRRLADRWVMSAPTRNLLVRNSIARMWWAAHLTHDAAMTRPLSKQTSDPFAYLAELTRTEDVFLGILDRDLAGCPDVLAALLDHFAANREYATEDYARTLLKEVVLVSGYSDIASFSYEEATTRVSAISDRIIAAGR